MPWGDKTGPAGTGPKTGRGAGFCAGSDAPGCANPDAGRGRKRGLGQRRGFGGGGRGRRFDKFVETGGRRTPNVTQATSALDEESASELHTLNRRLSDLQSELQNVKTQIAGGEAKRDAR
jgi:hypothetical protein